jgi:hypothetical protein
LAPSAAKSQAWDPLAVSVPLPEASRVGSSATAPGPVALVQDPVSGGHSCESAESCQRMPESILGRDTVAGESWWGGGEGLESRASVMAELSSVSFRRTLGQVGCPDRMKTSAVP